MTAVDDHFLGDVERSCYEGGSGELENIKYEEGHHFTMKRMCFMLVNFLILLANNMIVKNKDTSKIHKEICVVVFSILMIYMTSVSVNRIKRIHEVKNEQGYTFHEKDMRFDSIYKIINLALFCMIAAILCGMTGIAGGMVLGPLFLTYNMVPQVMSGTNQYITMIASIAVVFQFIYLDQLHWGYALIFGGVTILAAYTGIQSVNAYIKKSGKQSVIAILLVIVLTMAILSLPLKFVLK